MRKAIIDRQVKAIAENGLDAMVSCSPENYAYATGFVVPSQPLIRHRHAMAIVTADAKTELHVVIPKKYVDRIVIQLRLPSAATVRFDFEYDDGRSISVTRKFNW